MGAFTVVYDACVLYPPSIRDLLVELARTGLCRAKWTQRIHLLAAYESRGLAISASILRGYAGSL